MMAGKNIFVLILLLCALLPAGAQTADRLESVLASPRLSYAEAAWFALEAADKGTFPDAGAAFHFALERKWLPKKAAPNSEARLNGVALLLMRAFDVPGGLLYSVAKNPRYAYRELVSRDVILGRSDPDMLVSGDDFLFLLGRMFSLRGDEPEFPPESPPVLPPEFPPDPKIQEPSHAVTMEERIVYLEAEAQEINTQIEALAIHDTAATVTDAGIMISLSNIQFLADSAVLADSEKPKLQEIARILQSIPGKKISVAGHTALAGNTEGQLQLSYERAQSVAVLLISLGARAAGDVLVQGYGAERPVADNSTSAGMAANRRVEITILED